MQCRPHAQRPVLVRLALRYNIVTEHTSFVAVDARDGTAVTTGPTTRVRALLSRLPPPLCAWVGTGAHARTHANQSGARTGSRTRFA